MRTIQELRDPLPRKGQVEWIGIRPERREPLELRSSIRAIEGVGLEGDHRSKRPPNPKSIRQVTLFQWEHLPVIASMLGVEAIDPGLLRRNIAVSGINLLGLKDRRFQVGSTILEGSGFCHPCSRMEEIFGPGGYNAVRGHGGITARIIESGEIAIADSVSPVD